MGGARLLSISHMTMNAEDRRETLYREYNGLVMAIISAKLFDAPRPEIEDVAAGVWAKLFSEGCRRLDGFAHRAKFSTWLAQVAKNAAKDHLRKKKLLSVPLDAALGGDEDGRCLSDILPDGAPQPLDSLLDRETHAIVLAAVDGLPAIYRDVVRLRFFEGYPVAEIARRCGIDEDTVYVWLGRAFAKLRKATALADDA